MNEAEVDRIARLARLEFAEGELARFIPSFAEILDFFEQLKQVPTEDVEPTYHALYTTDLRTPLRNDQCVESLSVEEATREAPDARDGQFRVPKVIE